MLTGRDYGGYTLFKTSTQCLFHICIIFHFYLLYVDFALKSYHYVIFCQVLVNDEAFDFIYNNSHPTASSHNAVRRQTTTACIDGQDAGQQAVSSNRIRTPSVELSDKLNKKIRVLLEELDSSRKQHLSHPTEGIVFLTHEIHALCFERFELEDFPYDTQSLAIKVYSLEFTSLGLNDRKEIPYTVLIGSLGQTF